MSFWDYVEAHGLMPLDAESLGLKKGGKEEPMATTKKVTKKVARKATKKNIVKK